MTHPRLIALLLGCVTLLVFLPVGGFEFINFDDPDYVTANSHVIHGLTWRDITWAFTAFYASNWHPLTWISHMLDCQLFGLTPGAHHLVNAFGHALNAALLFTWLWRLTGKLWPAAIIAALFAWHPLHVESVAWVSERKDVLSTFFALLTLLAFTQYAQENNRRSFWLALVFFALGLLAKPMLVTLPCLLLLLDFWPLKRLTPFNRCVGLEKIPFFLLTTASCVVTFLAQKKGEAVVSLDRIPLSHRLANAPVAAMEYLQKLCVPANLSVIYPPRTLIPEWETLGSVGILTAISALAWQWRARRPYFLTGWLWFLGMLVPVIGLVQVGNQAMADRYSYFSAVGFFIMVVFLLEEVAERIRATNVMRTGVAITAGLGCIIITEHQLAFWRNSEILFRHAVTVTRDNSAAYVDLGAALGAQERWDEALTDDREALRLEPGWYQLHNNIANILDEHGQKNEAAAEYRQAIALAPRVSYLHKNLGMTLTELGQYDEAFRELSEASQLDPDDPSPHVETAKLFLAQGRDFDALTELRNAIDRQPRNTFLLAYTAHVLAANQNAAMRDGRTAQALALKALELGGTSVTIPDALGMAAAENGDYTNAIICAQNALAMAVTAGQKDTNAIRTRLELYQKHQPWRESFKMTNAPANAAQ